jgi:hypothetical protein
MLAIGQVTAGTAVTHLCNVPAGPCLVTITNDSASAGSAYVAITPSAAAGTAATLTTGNGIPVPAGQSLVFANYKASPAASLSVTSASTAATNVGFLISSAAGGTGF